MKILILSCNTGGGHNACGKHLKNEFNKYNIESDLIDYLEIASKKISNLIEKLYLDSTKGSGNIFKNVYKLGEVYNSTKLKSPVYSLNKLVTKKLKNYINTHNYDLIICTHLFPSMALTELNHQGENIKFINIATDYECIPFWNETNPNLFVIPSILLKNNFISKGINESILLPTGIPISSDFRKVTNNTNLPKDKKIVTIISGSMGFGNIKFLVEKLLKNITDVYFLVICGSNKKLESSLLEINNDNLIVKGFVNNINEYMAKSDIIITKPGGLTTTEVANLRKPFIHMMSIPGVENYNALFFSQNKMSLKGDTIDDVVIKLQELLNNKKLQKEMILNQKNI